MRTNVKKEIEIIHLLHDLKNLNFQERTNDNKQKQLHKMTRQFETYYEMNDKTLKS